MFDSATVTVAGSRLPMFVKRTVPVSPSKLKLPLVSAAHSWSWKSSGRGPDGATLQVSRPMAATASYSNAPMSRADGDSATSYVVKKSLARLHAVCAHRSLTRSAWIVGQRLEAKCDQRGLSAEAYAHMRMHMSGEHDTGDFH